MSSLRFSTPKIPLHCCAAGTTVPAAVRIEGAAVPALDLDDLPFPDFHALIHARCVLDLGGGDASFLAPDLDGDVEDHDADKPEPDRPTPMVHGACDDREQQQKEPDGQCDGSGCFQHLRDCLLSLSCDKILCLDSLFSSLRWGPNQLPTASGTVPRIIRVLTSATRAFHGHLPYLNRTRWLKGLSRGIDSSNPVAFEPFSPIVCDAEGGGLKGISAHIFDWLGLKKYKNLQKGISGRVSKRRG